MRNLRHRSNGFTIIEVMVVLAIAGLIMLIVFLAIPALQRNTRNHDRKMAVTFAATAMEEYKADHGGYPVSGTQVCNFLNNYMSGAAGTKTSGCSSTFGGGAGACITVQYSRYDVCYHDKDHAHHSYIGDDTEISIILSHWCNSGAGYYAPEAGWPITSGNNSADNLVQRYVVWIQLEHGPVFCIDNFPHAIAP
jgi:prepilin-type N-terminal cleavage/methylation domain-containing protein